MSPKHTRTKCELELNLDCRASTAATRLPCLRSLPCFRVGRFAGLRVDYSLSLVVSLEALFSLAQLGGIPRPSHDDVGGHGATVTLSGGICWGSWMTAQLLQWICLAASLVLLVAAFLSVRFGLLSCLVVDREGIPLLDYYAVLR